MDEKQGWRDLVNALGGIVLGVLFMSLLERVIKGDATPATWFAAGEALAGFVALSLRVQGPEGPVKESDS